MESLYDRIKRLHQIPTTLITQIEAKGALLRANIKPPAPAGNSPAHTLLSALADDGYSDVARTELANMRGEIKSAFKRVDKGLLSILADAKMHNALADYLEGISHDMTALVTDAQLRSAAYALDPQSPEAMAVAKKFRKIAEEAVSEVERIAPPKTRDGKSFDTNKIASNPCWYNSALNASNLVLAKQTNQIFTKLADVTNNSTDKRAAKAAELLVSRYKRVSDWQLKAKKQVQTRKGVSV